MEHYVNIMLDGVFKAVFGDKQVAMDLPMISRQGETGRDWKYELLPVYGIYLLNFSLPEFPLWRTDVVLANELTGETFGRIKLKQVYISFERFDLSYEECETPLEIIQSL